MMQAWKQIKQTLHLTPTLALLVILLLGFGLRLYHLGDQSIWWDEGHAIWAARQSLVETTRITAYDVHPPLYLWLLHFWLRLAGESEFAVRYLSLFGGLLTVALTYTIGRRLVGRRAALLGMLLIATARFHIWWSQETRMYVWATFFVLLSFYFFTHSRHGNTRIWWSYILSSAAALYTLYLAILALLIQNVFVLITLWRQPRRKSFLSNWLRAQVGIVVLYAPWLYLALSRTRTDMAKTSFSFRLIWQLYGTVLTTGISTNLDQYTWLLVAFGVVVVAGVALLAFDRAQPQRYGFAGWEMGVFFALPLLLPPLVIYALSIPRGFFYSPKPEARYLLLFAPLFYILIAGTMAGLWQKKRWGRAASIAVTMLVLGTFVSVLPAHYVGRYLRDDYQTAMYTLQAYARPDDAVLLVSGDRYPVFLYHFHRQFPGDQSPEVYLLPQHSSRFTAENVQAELAPLHEHHERLWLASFERSMQDPDNVVEGWLNAHRTATLNVPQGYNFLRLYTRDDDPPALELEKVTPQHPLAQPLGDHVLLGYDLPTTEFRPGDTVNPALYIQATSPVSLSVKWIHQEGAVIAQQERTLHTAQVARMMVPFAVYEYTPPGAYQFELCVQGTAACMRLAGSKITSSRWLEKRSPAVSRQIDLGEGAIQFLGYELNPAERARAGETLTVYLFWQTRQQLDKAYTVFVHLLGPYNPATGGPVWAQDDGYPLQGGHPTTRWLPGQTVPDRHEIALPPDMPAGVYQIEVGLYDGETGERLSVSAGTGSDPAARRILLQDVQIVTE